MTNKDPFYISKLDDLPYYLGKYKSKEIDMSKKKLEINMPVYNSPVSHPRLPSKLISKILKNET